MIYVLCIVHCAFAQTDSLNHPSVSMDDLYSRSEQKVIPLEKADELLRGARSFSLNDLNDEQGDKLMKVYKSIADAYAANFRFKPAYLVYDEYIGIKIGRASCRERVYVLV